MDGIEHFPPEFIEPFVFCFDYFDRCYYRYFDDSVWSRKNWRFFISSSMSLLHLTSLWMYIFSTFGSKIILDKGFMTASSLIGLQSVLKSFVIIPMKKDIENLIKGMAKMWKTENLSEIQITWRNRRLKQFNLRLAVFKWGASLAVFQNLFFPLICTFYGKIFKEDADFLLPYPSMYPFDPVKNWGRYLLTFFFQRYSMTRLVDYYLGTQFLIITGSSQLSVEFALLREDIKNAITMPNVNKIKQKSSVDKNMTIEAMVKNHQELINLAQLLNNIFNRMVFIDLCFFAVIGCFFSISFMVSNDITNKLLNVLCLTMFFFMIFLFCYYSEMLKEESAGIAEAAYENPWYEGGTHYQKTSRFMIMRAQHPCYITSLNYVAISLNTFTKIASTTWSYFSLAMAVFDDDN